MVIEDAALLNRRVTHMTPAALFSRRLQVNAVELTGVEYQALIQNPAMREQWELSSAPDESLAVFLNLHLADGHNLFLTMEVQAELLQSDLWDTGGFFFKGSGICFRMRGGGIAVLNIAHLTGLTLFPKPPQLLNEMWRGQHLHQTSATRTAARNGSREPADGNMAPFSPNSENSNCQFPPETILA
jgi:hypothetical protein